MFSWKAQILSDMAEQEADCREKWIKATEEKAKNLEVRTAAGAEMRAQAMARMRRKRKKRSWAAAAQMEVAMGLCF